MNKKRVDNLDIDPEGGVVIVSINPKIYPIEIVRSASYVFIDKAFVVLDGDPEKEIKAILRPRVGKDLEKLGRDFNDELLNYAVYEQQSEKNKLIKESIVQRALFTNFGEDSLCALSEEESYVDDPLGISKTWEETKEE